MSVTAMYVLIIKYDANVLKDAITTLLCFGLETNMHNQRVTPASACAHRNVWSKVGNFLF